MAFINLLLVESKILIETSPYIPKKLSSYVVFITSKSFVNEEIYI